MSGGSFDYLYSRPEARPGEYENMAELMDRWPDAMAAVLRIGALKKEAEAEHEKLSQLLQAVEWWRSCDYGEDQVDEAVAGWRDRQAITFGDLPRNTGTATSPEVATDTPRR